jgi:hypothetical protein
MIILIGTESFLHHPSRQSLRRLIKLAELWQGLFYRASARTNLHGV